MSDKIPMHHLMYTQEQSGLKIQGPVTGGAVGVVGDHLGISHLQIHFLGE